MTTTGTILADLAVEGQMFTGAEQSEAGPRDVTLYRPHGTGLRNDGFRAFWMRSGQRYEIRHDGVAFRVTCRDWTDGHILRLVDAVDAHRWADTLETEQGIVVLDEATGYEILESAPGTWALYTI